MSSFADSVKERRPLLVSASPHIRDTEDVPRIMWTVAGVLVVPGLYGIVVFGLRQPAVGWNALSVLLISLAACVGTEYAVGLVLRRGTTVSDGSAVVTGLLLAYVLSPLSPWYVPLVGGMVAIGIVKMAFGGLGYNIWNPALAARAFLLASWSVALVSTWVTPQVRLGELSRTNDQLTAAQVDAVTAATPLSAKKRSLQAYNDIVSTYKERRAKGEDVELAADVPRGTPREVLTELRARNRTSLVDLLLGFRGGCLGETCVVLLVLGGVVLVACGYIRWYVPVLYVGTVALLTWALPVRVEMPDGPARLVAFAGKPLFNILSGGLMLGAIYMATDMVTTPLSRAGLVIFALGCGILTSIIRLYGGYPEGVAYSILLMNTATPLIDRFSKPKTFGAVGK